MVVCCSSGGYTRMTLSLLASATWSVPDSVRTDLRTTRLAIAYSDRNDRAMHPPQVAAITPIHILMEKERASFEGSL
jgi:hypothetical protein